MHACLRGERWRAERFGTPERSRAESDSLSVPTLVYKTVQLTKIEPSTPCVPPEPRPAEQAGRYGLMVSKSEDGSVMVKEIMPGGLAAEHPEIAPGDRVMRVNNAMSQADMMRELRDCSDVVIVLASQQPPEPARPPVERPPPSAERPFPEFDLVRAAEAPADELRELDPILEDEIDSPAGPVYVAGPGPEEQVPYYGEDRPFEEMIHRRKQQEERAAAKKATEEEKMLEPSSPKPADPDPAAQAEPAALVAEPEDKDEDGPGDEEPERWAEPARSPEEGGMFGPNGELLVKCLDTGEMMPVQELDGHESSDLSEDLSSLEDILDGECKDDLPPDQPEEEQAPPPPPDEEQVSSDLSDEPEEPEEAPPLPEEPEEPEEAPPQPEEPELEQLEAEPGDGLFAAVDQLLVEDEKDDLPPDQPEAADELLVDEQKDDSPPDEPAALEPELPEQPVNASAMISLIQPVEDGRALQPESPFSAPNASCELPAVKVVLPAAPAAPAAGEAEQSTPGNTPGEYEMGGVLFEYEALLAATLNFDKDHLLGKGGFGCVYQGDLHGTLVAVKRLDEHAEMDGLSSEDQFNAEVSVLTKFQHPNLVQLLGFSMDGPVRCLVYDFMEAGSLEDRLMCRGGTPALPWFRRVRIAHQSAKGIAYLHKAAGMAHRDIKTANILLDGQLQARIGDFGLVRSAPLSKKSIVKTQHVIGTNIYLPPEAHRGEISTAMDVYAMGVVLLELLSGFAVLDDEACPKDIVSRLEDKLDDQEDLLQCVDSKAGGWGLHAVLQIGMLAQGCLETRRKRRIDIDDLLKGLQDTVSSLPDDCCVVCWDKAINHAAAPCGHLSMCRKCAMEHVGQPCPICRKQVDSVLRVYTVV